MVETRETLRFGDFELDLGACELRRHGRAVRLERQPMDLLILLVERRGRLLARAEIVERLWGKDVFVDVDTGVNTAIRKIRQALRDSATIRCSSRLSRAGDTASSARSRPCRAQRLPRQRLQRGRHSAAPARPLPAASRVRSPRAWSAPACLLW